MKSFGFGMAADALGKAIANDFETAYQKKQAMIPLITQMQQGLLAKQQGEQQSQIFPYQLEKAQNEIAKEKAEIPYIGDKARLALQEKLVGMGYKSAQIEKLVHDMNSRKYHVGAKGIMTELPDGDYTFDRFAPDETDQARINYYNARASKLSKGDQLKAQSPYGKWVYDIYKVLPSELGPREPAVRAEFEAFHDRLHPKSPGGTSVTETEHGARPMDPFTTMAYKPALDNFMKLNMEKWEKVPGFKDMPEQDKVDTILAYFAISNATEVPINLLGKWNSKTNSIDITGGQYGSYKTNRITTKYPPGFSPRSSSVDEDEGEE